MDKINDVTAEKSVIAGLIQHGQDAFDDVDGILTANSFTQEENQIMWSCLEQLFKDSTTVDLPTLYGASKVLSLDEQFSKKGLKDYFKKLSATTIEKSNVNHQAATVAKLEVAREVYRCSLMVQQNILEVKSDKSISEILAIGEEPFYGLADTLQNRGGNEPVDIFQDIDEHIDDLIENPCEMMGVSTGFPRYDKMIGGGLRQGNVDLIGARTKVGKSFFADTVALHVAGKLNIPVLVLDTEMQQKDHVYRILASISDVQTNEISTGQFSKSKAKIERVKQAAETLKKMPYKYSPVAGVPIQEIVAIIRRWVKRVVGRDENGNTNPCLVVYDYLKLGGSSEMKGNEQPHIALGFKMQELVNVSIKENVSVLSFVQLNREGITREGEDVIAGSDDIARYCSSFCLFKKKSEEEVAEDGGESGNRKLKPILHRHGGGLEEDFDYVNMNLIGEYGKLVEGFTKSEYILANKKEKEGFDNEVNDNEEGFVVEEDIDPEKPF